MCVHVTSFHFTALGFFPRPLPGGEGVLGEAGPVLGRLVTGPGPRQRLPGSEHPEIVRKQNTEPPQEAHTGKRLLALRGMALSRGPSVPGPGTGIPLVWKWRVGIEKPSCLQLLPLPLEGVLSGLESHGRIVTPSPSATG